MILDGPSSVWKHRWLFLGFVKRELKSRYQGSIGGLIWVLMHPVILLAVYAVVFQSIFKVKFSDLQGHDFIVFLAVVLWPWMAFQEGLLRGTQAVLQNAALVKKVQFPHELLVYAAVVAAFTIQFGGYIVVITLLQALGYGLAWSSLAWVVVLSGILFCVTIGLSLALCAIQVYLKDVEQVLSQVLMLLFYLTPILYPVTLLPENLQQILFLNFLSHIFGAIRNAWLYGMAPGYWTVLALIAISAASVTLGRRLFLKMSPYFEDVI